MEAAQSLSRQAPWLTLAGHPIGSGKTPLQLLALAVPGQAIVVDASRCAQLADWLMQQAILGAHDGKAMAHALAKTYGIVPARWACAQVTQTLLAAGAPCDTDLKALAKRYALEIPSAPPDASLDAFAAWAITVACVLEHQAKALKVRNLGSASRIEAAALAPIAAMERSGMPFEAELWRACVREEAQEVRALTQTLGAVLKEPLAWDADEATVLAALRRAGHALPSFGQTAIAQLPAELSTCLGPLMQLRRQAAQLGDNWLRHVGTDGRIHAHFVQIGARTGRMACTRPNLQAITAAPARRACFAPKPGRRLVMGDYNACELRILAQMSQDPAFLAAFAAGVDVHAQVATELFGVPVSQGHNADKRQMAKVVSFGLIYGMGRDALGQALGLNPAAAAELVERYFARFPKVAQFLQDAAAAAVRAGEARSLSGRVLSLDPGANDGGATLRLARNMPIQGSSADMIKIALALLHAKLTASHDIQLVHCVHDEIVLECAKEATDGAMAMLDAAMREAGAKLLQSVPIAVTLQHRTSWQAH